MQSFAPYVLPVMASFVAAGAFLVLLLTFLHRGKAHGPGGWSRPMELECSECGRTMVIPRNELEPLVSAETALVVSNFPWVSRRPLADYRCPYCTAVHTFAVDVTPPQWITVNAFIPGGQGNYCSQCRKRLKRAGWAKGAYDGRLAEAPDLTDDHGLVCPRCHAVSCVACCKDATRNRTTDGSLLCPRCHRGPVDLVHHF